MSKCILRVAKISSHGSATGKTSHNYRLAEVPNADPERKHLNQEYINNGEKNIWTLANERIERANIKGVRKDAVRGMEFLITASPDAFQRDDVGQIKDDYRNTTWVANNLKFLSEKYGANLVAFTLHQDEKTPHIHAVVVPITTDGRLSAKELFNPKTLRSLQTDYAKAMSTYGFERGIEGSRARHQTMKQIYGQQQKVGQEIETDLKALQQHERPLTIEKPGTFDLLNLERWRQQQEAIINAELMRRLNEARKVAEKAQKLATANATAAEQVRVLQQRLNTSESLKQTNFEKASKSEKRGKDLENNFDRVMVLADEGRISKEWLKKQADRVRTTALPQMKTDLWESLQEVSKFDQFYERLREKGYKLLPEDNIQYLEHPTLRVRIDLSRAEFDGKLLHVLVKQSVEQTRQREADKKAAEEETQRIAAEKKNKQQPKLGRSTGGHSP